MPLKVLIVWEYGGHLGHLGKLLPVAQVLRETGHEVVFGVADEASARPFLNSAGFASISIPLISLPAKTVPGDDAISHAEVLLRCGFADGPLALAGVKAWHHFLIQVKPDAMLVDASPLALYAARSMGLRSMAMGHGFDIPPQGAKPCFAPWVVGAAQRMRAGELALQTVFDQLAAELCGLWGVQVPRSTDELFSPEHCLICTWPELDHFDRPAPAQVETSRYVGPIWGELPGATSVSWSQVGIGMARPKVLCYVYPHKKCLDLIWQSLVQKNADVLVVAPGASDAECQAIRACNVQVTNRPTQLGSLLSQCHALVCHGGVGLVSMALHAGKPLLLLPEYMEHAVLAYRLSRQGLALATVRLLDANVVNEKVARLLGDAALIRNAGAFAAKYAHYSPTAAAKYVAIKTVNLQR